MALPHPPVTATPASTEPCCDNQCWSLLILNLKCWNYARCTCAQVTVIRQGQQHRWASRVKKTPSPSLKKPNLLTTYILPMRYPISRHARTVSPLRLYLSIIWLWLYGGKAHSSDGMRSDCTQDEVETGGWNCEMREEKREKLTRLIMVGKDAAVVSVCLFLSA